MSADPLFDDLIRRVRAGDHEAAAELVRSYETYIRMVVRKKLRNPALRGLFDSMDVCQSILGNFFVRAALGQFNLDAPENLRQLLVTMALNKVRTLMRKQTTDRRDYQRTKHDSDAARQVADPGPSPSQVVADQDLLQEVGRRLSEEERRIKELRDAGCSWEETAARLGGKPDALRMRLDRAIHRVLGQLGLDE